MKKNITNKDAFLSGFKDAIPIGAGYLAVSFSLGIMAKKTGLSPMQGFISSLLNHASAGEYAEFTVIRARASFLEMALIIFITNLRYSLMSLSYSQRFSKDTRLIHRLLMCFGISDEIYGISIAKPGCLNPYYTYGAMVCAIPAWSAGTAIGIIAGNVLPASAVASLSVALYGMFLAIIIPPAKKDRVVLILIIISFIASFAASKLPWISSLTEGMRTIILTLSISILAAVLFPKELKDID